MRLKDLIDGIYDKTLPEKFRDLEVRSICSDSRKVGPGSLFVAVQGATANGTDFIRDAVSKGAGVIVSGEVVPNLPAEVCVLSVPQTHGFLIKLLLRFYDDPSRRIRVFGVTGTNGKTTSTYLMESIFLAAGHACGTIGTVNYRFGSKVFKAPNTTPGPAENFRLLSEMIASGMTHCVMEISSHALEQDRVDGIDFRCGLFTNLTSDHMDYHLNRENYFLAKARLLTGLSSSANAVINNDDPVSERLRAMTPCPITTYGIKKTSQVMARDIRLRLSGTAFLLTSPAGNIEITTPLIGEHNVYNILGAAAACLTDGIPLNKIASGVQGLQSVPGRLEPVQAGQDFFVFVDYAHTEDALKNVLMSLRRVSSQKIILVFGCGGDRDQTKRPLMGKAANDLADVSILTNDNPRSENPLTIIEQVRAGFDRGVYHVIPDRKAAIEYALGLAKPENIVLIAGKGHEDYQIFQDGPRPFCEPEIIKSFLRNRQGFC